MATAKDFEKAAAEFQGLMDAAVLRRKELAARWDDGVVKGGSLERIIAQALDATDGNTNAIASTAETMHGECLKRVKICEKYTEDMKAYRVRYAAYTVAHLDWIESGQVGPEPVKPPRVERPYPWVEESGE